MKTQLTLHFECRFGTVSQVNGIYLLKVRRTTSAIIGRRNVSSILRQLWREISVERFYLNQLFHRLPHCSQVLACVKGSRVEYHVRLASGHP